MNRYKRRRKVASYSYSPRESYAQKEKRAYRRISLITICIIILVVLLFKYGAVVIERMTSAQNSFDNPSDLETNDNTDNLLWTPTIDSLPSQTNQPKISVSGTAYQGIQVELFLNGESVSIDDLNEEMKFEFTDLNLDAGENTIAVRAIKENGEKSDLSETVKITLDLLPPTLTISAPTNGETFSADNQKVTVSGTTEPDAKAKVNDHIAIVANDGNFSYQLTLKEGENTITVTATDEAGNEAKEEIKVTLETETN